MDNRTERVVFETRHARIIGDLTLPKQGYRSRISDYLNRGDAEFVPLTDATITAFANGEKCDRQFIVVARAHIHLAYPVGEDEIGDPTTPQAR